MEGIHGSSEMKNHPPQLFWANGGSGSTPCKYIGCWVAGMEGELQG